MGKTPTTGGGLLARALFNLFKALGFLGTVALVVILAALAYLYGLKG